MASKPNKKATTGIISEIPECPVCFEPLTAPIYQCKTGHSLCNSCTRALLPPVCPLCRQDMTQTRSLLLEELVSKAQVTCPNKSAGCIYTMSNMDVEEHLKECIFRKMNCPWGVIFGKCSWIGHMKEMLNHFKERHPNNCNISENNTVEINNVNIKEDDRYFYLVPQGKFLFILTVRLDTQKNMIYWSVQHIGSKNAAMQYVYEIHLGSLNNEKRKIVFTEQCFNDAIKADEVFSLAKCPMLPLNSLSTFIKNKKFSFQVYIRKIQPPNPKNKGNKNLTKDGQTSNFNKPKFIPKPGLEKKNKNINQNN